MERISTGVIVGLAGLAWVGVALYGVWEIAGEEAGDGWERPYLLFSISLFIAVTLTFAAAWSCTRGTRRTTLRRFGLGVGMIAVVGSIVAWALPLWMTLIAIALIALTAVAPRNARPGLAALVAGQLVGMAVMFGGIFAELGQPDRYGDYPAAFGLGLVVTGAVSAFAMAVLARGIVNTDVRAPQAVGGPSAAMR